MESFKREYLLYRIVNGYLPYQIGKTILHIKSPSLSILYRASERFCTVYGSAMSEGLMTDNDVYDMLLDLKMWTPEDENNLVNVLPKHIDYWKEQLYLAIFKSKDRERIRKYLAAAKDELSRLYSIRHSFDHATCSGVANYAKFQYIIEKSTYLPSGKRYDWAKSSPYLVMLYYQDKTIREDDIRELSHTSPWDSIWLAGKHCGSLFNEPAIKLSLEQQRLIAWSSLYDNIKDSPDCPADEILYDDDMLDGWLIIQKREREKNQIKSQGEKTIGNEKIANASEVYLPAQTFEDAKKIDMLNDNFARGIKKQRFATIAKHGQINEASLPDIKQDIQMEMTKMLSNSMKRGR